MKTAGWIVLFGILVLILVQASHLLPLFDFVEYWSAGYLNRIGKNPYGLKELKELQIQLGWTYPEPLVAWNPPWSISLMMLFSLLPYPVMRAIWLVFSTAVVLLSAEKSRHLYNVPFKSRRSALLAGITFSPVFFNLLLGQITPLVLLGYIGFFILSESAERNRQKGLAAGACLALTAIKPQLLYLFFFLVFLWSISRRNGVLLLGFFITLFASSLIVLPFNPGVFRQYLIALSDYPPNYWATPTLGYYLREWFGLRQFWLQFLPALPGLVWMGYYWHRNRASWNWKIELPIVTLVSLLTASYTWLHDLIILVPVVVLMMFWFNQRPRSVSRMVLFLLYWVANIAYLILHFQWDDSRFIWFTPLILLLYLPVHHWIKQNPKCL